MAEDNEVIRFEISADIKLSGDGLAKIEKLAKFLEESTAASTDLSKASQTTAKAIDSEAKATEGSVKAAKQKKDAQDSLSKTIDKTKSSIIEVNKVEELWTNGQITASKAMATYKAEAEKRLQIETKLLKQIEESGDATGELTKQLEDNKKAYEAAVQGVAKFSDKNNKLAADVKGLLTTFTPLEQAISRGVTDALGDAGEAVEDFIQAAKEARGETGAFQEALKSIGSSNIDQVFKDYTNSLDDLGEELDSNAVKWKNAMRLIEEANNKMKEGDAEFSAYEDRAKGAAQAMELLAKEGKQASDEYKKLQKVFKESVDNAHEFKVMEERVAAAAEGGSASFDSLSNSIGQASTTLAAIGGGFGELVGGIGAAGSSLLSLKSQFFEIDKTAASSSQAMSQKFMAGAMGVATAALAVGTALDNMIRGQETATIEAGKAANAQNDLVNVYKLGEKTIQDRIQLTKDMYAENPKLAQSMRAVVGDSKAFDEALKTGQQSLLKLREEGASKEWEVQQTGGGIFGWFKNLFSNTDDLADHMGVALTALENFRNSSAQAMTAGSQGISAATSAFGQYKQQIVQMDIQILEMQGKQTEADAMKLNLIRQQGEELKNNLRTQIAIVETSISQAQVESGKVTAERTKVMQQFMDYADNVSGLPRFLDGIDKQLRQQLFQAVERFGAQGVTSFEEFRKKIEEAGGTSSIFTDDVQKAIGEFSKVGRIGVSTEQAFEQSSTSFINKMGDNIQALLQLQQSVGEISGGKSGLQGVLDELKIQLGEVDGYTGKIIARTKTIWELQRQKDAAQATTPEVTTDIDIDALNRFDALLKNKLPLWANQTKEVLASGINDFLTQYNNGLVATTNHYASMAAMADAWMRQATPQELLTFKDDLIKRNQVLGLSSSEEAQIELENNNRIIQSIRGIIDTKQKLYTDILASGNDRLTAQQDEIKNWGTVKKELTETEKIAQSYAKTIEEAKKAGVEPAIIKQLAEQGQRLVLNQKSLDMLNKIESERLKANEEINKQLDEQLKKLTEQTAKRKQYAETVANDNWNKSLEGMNEVQREAAKVGMDFQKFKEEWKEFPDIIAIEAGRVNDRLVDIAKKAEQSEKNRLKAVLDETEKVFKEKQAKLQEVYEQLRQQERDLEDKKNDATLSAEDAILKLKVSKEEWAAREAAKSIANQVKQWRDAGVDNQKIQEWLKLETQRVYGEMASSTDQATKGMADSFRKFTEAAVNSVYTMPSAFDASKKAIEDQKKALDSETGLGSEVRRLEKAFMDAKTAYDGFITGGKGYGVQAQQDLKDYAQSQKDINESFEDFKARKRNDYVAQLSKELDQGVYGGWAAMTPQKMEEILQKWAEADFAAQKVAARQLEGTFKDNPLIQGLKAAEAANAARIQAMKDVEIAAYAVEKNIKDAAINSQKAVNDVAKELSDAVKGGKLVEIQEAWSKAGNEAGNSFANAVEQLLVGFDGASGLAAKVKGWGATLTEMLKEGLESNLDMIEEAAGEGAMRISLFFEPHSPPKKGALSTIDKWMPKLLKLLTTGGLSEADLFKPFYMLADKAASALGVGLDDGIFEAAKQLKASYATNFKPVYNDISGTMQAATKIKYPDLDLTGTADLMYQQRYEADQSKLTEFNAFLAALSMRPGSGQNWSDFESGGKFADTEMAKIFSKNREFDIQNGTDGRIGLGTNMAKGLLESSWFKALTPQYNDRQMLLKYGQFWKENTPKMNAFTGYDMEGLYTMLPYLKTEQRDDTYYSLLYRIYQNMRELEGDINGFKGIAPNDRFDNFKSVFGLDLNKDILGSIRKDNQLNRVVPLEYYQKSAEARDAVAERDRLYAERYGYINPTRPAAMDTEYARRFDEWNRTVNPASVNQTGYDSYAKAAGYGTQLDSYMNYLKGLGYLNYTETQKRPDYYRAGMNESNAATQTTGGKQIIVYYAKNIENYYANDKSLEDDEKEFAAMMDRYFERVQ